MAEDKKEDRSKKGIFQKAFYSRRIKLSICAVATIAVAITALYFFRPARPGIKVEEPPVVTAKEQNIQPLQKKAGISYQDKKAAVVEDIKAESAAPVEEPPAVTAKEQNIQPEEKAGISHQKETTAVVEESKADRAMPDEEPMPVIASVTPQEEIIHELPLKETTQVLAAAPKTESPIRRKREHLNWTLNVSDLDTAQKKCEEIIIEAGGNILKKESAENKKVIVTEMDADKLKELGGKIKSIGNFINVKDFKTIKEEIMQIVLENGCRVIEEESSNDKKVITVESFSKERIKKVLSRLEEVRFIEEVKETDFKIPASDAEIMIVLLSIRQ